MNKQAKWLLLIALLLLATVSAGGVGAWVDADSDGVTDIGELRGLVETGISSLSLGPGHNPTESLVEMLEGTGFTTRVDKERLRRIKDHFNTVRPRYAEFLSNITGVETEIFDSQIPGGILWDAVTTGASADGAAVAIVRDAEVNGGDLVWSADIEAGEITTATTHLAALGIIVR